MPQLERRWNEKLIQLRDLELQLQTLTGDRDTPVLSADDRTRLMTLGRDLGKAWDSPNASIETRKKIIRLLIKEIIVDIVDDTLVLIIHWQGGDHTRMTVKKNKIGQTRWAVKADLVDLVRALARPELSIAAILNRSGKRPVRGVLLYLDGFKVCPMQPILAEGERRSTFLCGRGREISSFTDRSVTGWLEIALSHEGVARISNAIHNRKNNSEDSRWLKPRCSTFAWTIN